MVRTLATDVTLTLPSTEVIEPDFEESVTYEELAAWLEETTEPVDPTDYVDAPRAGDDSGI